MKKSSFFSRITGADDQDDNDYFGSIASDSPSFEGGERHMHLTTSRGSQELTSEGELGELAVDVYQTPDAIVVKAVVAGVQPTAIEISLTREMLTISGSREDEREVEDDGYFQRELYWGAFSRTILLPEEVDVDMAEASEKHGILMIRLPKINKKKQAKLKVRVR